MASKLKEKFELLRNDEIKYRDLIKHFKKAIQLWFIYGTNDNTIVKEVLKSCEDIIIHGLKSEAEKLQIKTSINGLDYDSSPTVSSASTNANSDNNNVDSDLKLNELHKIIDDLEWVRNAAGIGQNIAGMPLQSILSEKGATSLSLQNQYMPMSAESQSSHSTIVTHVTQWLNHNLSEHNLCSFIQYLVNDKELLEEHYYEEALLRQEKYVKILVIGLTAFETQQYGLLSQIDAVIEDDLRDSLQPKRSNSQPNVIIVPIKKPNLSIATDIQHQPGVILKAIRRTKSLSEFVKKKFSLEETLDGAYLTRRRCKTIHIATRRTNPQYIPQKNPTQSTNFNINISDFPLTTSSYGSFLHDYDNLPTTSQANSNRSKSPISNNTLSSNESATSSLTSTSSSSFKSENTSKCIEVINTDNIKIWTDYSWELRQKNKQKNQQQQTTASCAIPTPLISSKKLCNKSSSPLNDFFSSLFRTPPSYTTWFIDHEARTKHEVTETAIESIIPDNNDSRNNYSVVTSQQQAMGSTVFDKFLPIDGKKLKSRKSQNLFDNINTIVECSGVNKIVCIGNRSMESPLTSCSPGSMATPENCQSLTRFLQMSHLSRSSTDTELEKENAHFRISEAIISAIEHIKWNTLESQKNKSCPEATPLATDCLASSSSPQVVTHAGIIASEAFEAEHIPYAELEEVCYDHLSAEIVGLSLISKFDEKDLPKVSELKWLVSDDDTPQNLLPIPDITSSTNPDDHVIHSATRGTRYWAPPRQQIIFTDHPPVNRKELLKKQNNRCAGCGMRVSPGYMHSFRYCTYLGKYHCTGCHRNQISATPAKILQNWDFKCYPVSVFAYRLLEQMSGYPLFYVPDLNPALYIRCKSLHSARNKRLQLKYVKDFISMCRFATREQSYFESVPDYITADIDNWSMSDFIDARNKCLHRSIDELIKQCQHHIFNCVLCTARGFLCELCHADVVIYPWDLRVERCERCGSCFHRNCWKSMSEICTRCQRIDKRQIQINVI